MPPARRLIICMLIGLAALRNAAAGIVLYTPETWSNVAGSVQGWVADGGNATLTNPDVGGTGGGADGFLQIEFDGVGVETDVVYAAGSSYTGSYQVANLAVAFSFWADVSQSDAYALQFHSTVSDTTWEYSFSAATANAWQSVLAPFNFDSGWVGGGGATASNFWADLASVDWVGVQVSHPGGGTHVFGIDDWEYTTVIPEPGTVAVLCAALASMVATYRRHGSPPSSGT